MYQLITLPNGVRIVCEPMPSVRSAAVGIWVGVGSRFERREEAGSAHFIEHMLFKGSSVHSAAELAEEMDAIGGQCNAFTGRESTCFYARVLDSHLDTAFGILSEMFFDSLFAQRDVEGERSVILEEIDMCKDSPEDLVEERLLSGCFPGSLGRPVLGTPAALRRMTGESLRAFKEREYSPERIVISLCGSFTEQNVHRLEECFSALPPSSPRQPRACAYAPTVTLRRRSTEQNHFCLGWPGEPCGSERRFAWQILSTVFGEGLSSRLFQTVREKYGLCYAIGSFTASFSETGLFGVSTAVGRETEKKALALIAGEVEKLRQEGVTEQELSRARELIKANLLLAMESTASRMHRLGAGILQLGRCLSPEDVAERYDAVTREEILVLAREMLAPESLSFSAVGHLTEAEDYLSLLR